MADYLQDVSGVNFVASFSPSDLKPALVCTQVNVANGGANVEVSYAIPACTRKLQFYLIGADTTDVLKYYWAVGGSANAGELYGQQADCEDNLYLTGKTIYFKPSVGVKAIHVDTWQ